MSQPTSRHLFVALACAASLLCGAAPTALAAASPSPSAGSSTKPSIMRQASEALSAPASQPATSAPARPAAPLQVRPASSALNRQVFGFAQAGALGSSSAGYPSWNFGLLTTVAYFGVHVNNDGTLVTNDTGWSVWNSSTLTNMVGAAHAAGTRVVLTIIKQDVTGGMCTALQNGATTVAQTVAQVNAKGVDGVNIDYEGSAVCPASNGYFVSFVQQMRAALGAGRNLTVDTYGASAAPGGDGFFNLAGMAPYVDAFFVMAYELDNSNWHALGCPSYCMNPTSPYSYYSWNDQKVAAQYVSAVGGAKTILGLPYYGWAACVTSAAENATVTGSPQWTANTQLATQGLDLGPQHTDSHDGVDHWYAGYPNSYGCTRELYLDDASTLSAKYQIVNNYGLQGAGIWSLDMGGGLTSLWNAIAANFGYTPGIPVSPAACPGNGYATVTWGPAPAPYGISSYTATASPGGSQATVGPYATTAAVGGLTNGQAYTLAVQAANSYGSGPASPPTNTVTPAPPPGTWPARFHPVPSYRVLDTRNGGGPVPALGQVAVSPSADPAIPATGVQGLVLNVTATNGAAPGYLTVFADGSCRPTASNLHFGRYQTIAGLTQTGLGADGKVALFNGSGAGSVDVVVDVVGYLSDSSIAPDSQYRPLAHPQRLMDTRNGTGGFLGKLGPGQSYDLVAGGALNNQIPPTAAGLAVNVTVTDGDATSYVYVHPTGQGGAASTINFTAGQVIANRATVALSGGKLTVFNSAGHVNVIVDVAGYFTSSNDGGAGGYYTAMAPVRVYDSRSVRAPVGAGQWRKVQVAGLLSVPGTARAVVLTLTGTNVTAPTFLAVDPLGDQVRASDVNLPPSATVANLVIAAPNPVDGTVEVYNSAGSTDIIADVVGWYS